MNMAIAPVTSTATKNIQYLNKNFLDFKLSLTDFAKAYFPNTYTDFSEAAPGMLFIEMASYVGDVLSFYIDKQFKENLIQYAEEQTNLVSIAQSLGYKPKPATASTVKGTFYQLVPATVDALTNYQPDTKFYLRIAPNSTFSPSNDASVIFRNESEINFSDSLDRTVTIYNIDSNGLPATYLVRKDVKLVAGVLNTTTFSFGTIPQKFSTRVITDSNPILGIAKVIDEDGHEWREVDYLAQDLVIDERLNTSPTDDANQSVPPTYMIRLRKEPRRFVTRYRPDFSLELLFGSGVKSDDDTSIALDVRNISSEEYSTRLGSNPLDPSDFLSSKSYGLAPVGTLTVTYITGGGVLSNIPAGTLNTTRNLTVLNNTNVFTDSEIPMFQDVVKSLVVDNIEAATGGKNLDSAEEIRQNAMAFFNAQNRLVTHADYIVRSYAMPSRFGGVAKAFVVQDDQLNSIQKNNVASGNAAVYVTDNISTNAVNLYVLGYDKDSKLTTLNADTKRNLSTYLNEYRMLTDKINILDAFVVNIGVQFKVTTYRGYNMSEVVTRCIDTIQTFFDITKWDINQPIILSDLQLSISQVDGVRSIEELKIVNKYRHKDHQDYNEYLYDIDAATDKGIIFPSMDPTIFELRYPSTDIVGSATQ